MKKLVFLLVLIVAFALMGGVALAETPHGPFDANTQVCAACHRAHTSSAEYLLATPRVTSLCTGCHDGTGADTNVINGIYVIGGTENHNGGNDALNLSGYNHSDWGAVTYPLMGGGFTRVNGGTGPTTASATTSKHMDPSGGLATTLFQYQWGKYQNGSSSVGPSDGYTKTFLDCVDCHMPHKSQNYRMLRVKPTGYGGDALVTPQHGITSGTGVYNASSNPGRRYTEDSGMFNTTMDVSGGTPTYNSISKWCGRGCHDYYYEPAVRIGNGHTGTKSPQIATRTTVTMTVAGPTITVQNASVATNGSNVYVNGVAYVVLSHNDATVPNTITLATNIGAGQLPLYAGSSVVADGQGMKVYYNLDGVAGNDPGFMHAVDVDLLYTPRNDSSSQQGLAVNLGQFGDVTYANKMPVADQNSNFLYDDSDVLTCTTCHRAHGTDVPMSGAAALLQRQLSGVYAPSSDTTVGQGGNGSMLLRLENRAICQQCHQMPTGF